MVSLAQDASWMWPGRTLLRNYFDVKIQSRLALVCIVALAGSLDLHNLSSQPFWLDEALSDAVANSHGMSFVKLAFEREASMAFYYITLHEWLSLVSPTDFNIRLLSSIFAVGAVVALYVLARKLFGPAIGLAAAALLAVNPLFLSYAQEARSYTLTMFLTLVSWSFLIESCREPKSLNLWTYVVSATLAIYSHNLAMLILPAQFVALILFQHEANTARFRVTIAICAICVLIVPLFLVAAYFSSGDADWIAVGIGPPGLHSLREVAVSFAGAIAPPRIRQRLLEVLFAGGFCMFLEQIVTAIRRRSVEVDSYVLVVNAFGLPIALLMGVSQIFPLFIVRYVLICLPFLLLMITLGWLKCSQHWAVAVGMTLLVLLSLWADQSYYSTPTKPDWQKAIEYITENARDGDKLVFAPAYGRLEFDHNLKRFVGRGTQLTIVYPEWNSTFEVRGQYMGSPALTRTALNAPHERLWIVRLYQTGDTTEQVLDDSIAKYSVVWRKQFRGISVIFCGYSLPSRASRARTG